MQPELDLWATWLNHTRYGNDPAQKLVVNQAIQRIIRRLFRRMAFRDGMTVLDVGSGDGVVAEALIRRGGPTIKVIVSDISADALDQARERMRHIGVENQCRFIEMSAESLDAIDTKSMDAIVCRASYAYVADKGRAAAEFSRVLKMDGVVSMAEPVLQDESFMARALKRRVEESNLPDLFFDLVHRWKSAQFPDSFDAAMRTPLVNFSERDLVTYFIKNGFTDVHLRLWIDVGYAPPQPWDTFLNSSPHPLAPTLAAIIDTQFSEEERAYFEERLRPIVTEGLSLDTGRIAYLWASKGNKIPTPAIWLAS